ncbi:MAG: nicotinamide mononucleotide transporter [Alphaproteobacteria bacterium]
MVDFFTIFTCCLTAVTIYGTLLNSQQKKIGFLVWGLCNVAWLFVDAYRGIWAQSALYSVFIGFNIYGWMQWSKKAKQHTKEISHGDEREAA